VSEVEYREVFKNQMKPPEYAWEIQKYNNLTDELLGMVQRETLPEAWDAAEAIKGPNPICHVALIHRTEDTLLAAPMRGRELSEYFEDVTRTQLERVPERFRKEFNEMFPDA